MGEDEKSALSFNEELMKDRSVVGSWLAVNAPDEVLAAWDRMSDRLNPISRENCRSVKEREMKIYESIAMVGKAIELADAALEVDDGHRVGERMACPFCQAVGVYRKAKADAQLP